MARPAGSSVGSRPEAEQAVTPSKMARPVGLRAWSRGGGGRYAERDGEAGAFEGVVARRWRSVRRPRWRGRRVRVRCRRGASEMASPRAESAAPPEGRGRTIKGAGAGRDGEAGAAEAGGAEGRGRAGEPSGGGVALVLRARAPLLGRERGDTYHRGQGRAASEAGQGLARPPCGLSRCIGGLVR